MTNSYLLRKAYLGKKIQWVQDGQEIFEEPKVCTDILKFLSAKYFGNEPYFAFVEGSDTGIPLEQVEIVE